MRNRTYGGVRGRKTKVGRKLLRFFAKCGAKVRGLFQTTKFYDLFSFEKYFLEGFSPKNRREMPCFLMRKSTPKKHTWLVVKNTRHIF